MPINRRFFFEACRVKPFRGRLLAGQVEGLTAILDHWDGWDKRGDDRWLAYMLATVFHETAETMQPVRETLAPTDEAAIERLDRAFAQGRLGAVKTPYWRRDADGKSWLGRGFVQLTHRRNYRAMSAVIGVDLLARPEQAMERGPALAVLFEGMARGVFTGRKLADFFDAGREDWLGARAIINGSDRAGLIAGYGRAFYGALSHRPG